VKGQGIKCTFGERQFGLARLPGADLLGREQRSGGFAATWQQWAFADRVAECASEIQQCGFTGAVHLRQIRLHHHFPTLRLQLSRVRHRLFTLIGNEAPRPARAGTHRGLEHELGERREIVGRIGEAQIMGFNHRNTGTAELTQIALVGIPVHHIQRIDQPGLRRNAFAPSQKLRQTVAVVPG
jgi:hypothetical protein